MNPLEELHEIKEAKKQYNRLKKDIQKLRSLLSTNLESDLNKKKEQIYITKKTNTLESLHEELAILLNNFKSVQKYLYENKEMSFKEIDEKEDLFKKSLKILNSIKVNIYRERVNKFIETADAAAFTQNIEDARDTVMGCKVILGTRKKYQS